MVWTFFKALVGGFQKTKFGSSLSIITSPPPPCSKAQHALMLPKNVLVLNDYVPKAKRFVTLWLGYFHRSVERSGSLLLDWMNTSISGMLTMVTITATTVLLTSYWGAKPGDHPLAVRVEMEPIAAVNLKQNSSKSFAKCSLQQEK